MQKEIRKEDRDLISAYQDGEIEALSELVHKYKDKIFTSIILLVKNRELSEDIFQETFIKIIDKINNGSYVDKGKFLPWAVRIAHNLCIDYFRKKKREAVLETSEDNDIFNLISLPEPNIEEAIIKEQSSMLIRQMLEQLAPEQREVIVLRHYGGLSFKEISIQTNVSINTALGRMRYGLINLRKIVEQNRITL